MKWYTTRFIVSTTIYLSIVAGVGLSIYLKSETPWVATIVPVLSSLGTLANHKHQETKQKSVQRDESTSEQG